MQDQKIDFVIPWVDDSDPIWREDKNKYWNEANGKEWFDGNSSARFRDWDNLRYWFRGVEKFAPWVNCIYFVTYGHLPKWLNINHPKLRIIKHEDYIPKKYLPVFSANPIEINFHRIPNLGEQFVYFNDDMFIINDMQPEDFFVDGKPREIAALYPLTNDGKNDTFPHMLLTMTGLINDKFSKKEVIKKNFGKWFSPCYGKFLLGNLLMYRYVAVSGLIIPHLPSALKKSTMEEVWSHYENRLWEVTSHRFRDASDITQYFFRYWTIMSGEFVPTNIFKYGAEFFVTSKDIDILLNAIDSQKYKMICINDSTELDEFESVKKQVNAHFDKILGNKSAFEL